MICQVDGVLIPVQKYENKDIKQLEINDTFYDEIQMMSQMYCDTRSASRREMEK